MAAGVCCDDVEETRRRGARERAVVRIIWCNFSAVEVLMHAIVRA